MSTTTAPAAEIDVPRELLPALRENIRSELTMYGQSLDERDDAEAFDESCDRIERLIAARRALTEDADTYPVIAVRHAAMVTIRDAESRIQDDPLSVEETKFYVDRVRVCEALLERTM